MAQTVYVNLKEMVLETCCRCGTSFCMSVETYKVANERKEQGSFYCPHGHSQHYVSGERNEDKMRRERDRAVQEQARLAEVIAEKNRQIERERETAKKALAVQKGKVTRITNRVRAGVCIDCNRTFTNLGRHMATKHPSCEQVA